jgi:SPP1 family predicted phage head-tail adaptor
VGGKLMRRKDVIKLISISYSENDIGDTIETQTKREVLAEKKSIKQSEFYQAQATGLRPELTFVVWSAEYDYESKLEYSGKQYTIIRTYETDGKNIELICSGLVNGVN